MEGRVRERVGLREDLRWIVVVDVEEEDDAVVAPGLRMGVLLAFLGRVYGPLTSRV